MAGTVSAHPRGTSVLSRTLAEGYCGFTELLLAHSRTMSACWLQLAAVMHLCLLAFAEAAQGSRNLLPLVIVTGLVLVLSAFANLAVAAPLEPLPRIPEKVPAPADDILPTQTADLSQFFLSSRELALERQSQRLVEIADTAVRSRSQAEQRGQAWAELMSRVSHELRTPLNAVIGFSDIMNAEIFGPVGHPRYREYVGHIRDSGRALLKSAEDTLALTALLAQPGSLKPEVLDLKEFVRDAWTFVALDSSAHDLELRAGGLNGIEVLGERRPLRQILINLLSAATARAAPGSAIEIMARPDGDLIELEIVVATLAPPQGMNDGALALSLARALLELQDSSLLELKGSHTWRAVTVLSAATQADFFTEPGRTGVRCLAFADA